MVDFSELLDEDFLRNIAGDRYFERGVDYLKDGLVETLAQYGDEIVADVLGTRLYHVRLWLSNDRFYHDCTCPLGEDDLFCKHCVATALAWIAEPPPYQEPREQVSFAKKIEKDDIEAYLQTLSKEYLIELILDRAQTDEQWQQQLRLKIAANQTGGANMDTFRRVLKTAIAVDGYIDYNDVYDYADNIDTVLGELASLVDQQPQAVMDLCEEAMLWLEAVLNSVDDSSGHLGDTIHDVESLHLTAAQKTKLPPAILAQRLFNLEINSDFGFFHDSLKTYKKLLGQEGLRAYQQIIDAEWRQLADISFKGKQSSRDSFDYRGSQIRRLKEQVEKLLKKRY